MLVASFMKNGAMQGLFFRQKRGTFRFAKNGVVFVFLTSVRSYCHLYVIRVRRLQIIMEDFGMDAQTGFRPGRGTIDGLLTAFVGLHKRKEHWLETRALFIDLVKAFGTLPRETLFAILRRFSLPDHFVNIVIRLHENALINVKTCEDDSEVESSVGVR